MSVIFQGNLFINRGSLLETDNELFILHILKDKGDGWKLRIGFVSKPDCPKCIEVIQLLRHFLISEGHEAVLESSVARELNTDGFAIGDFDAEAILTVGGDGTALWTLQKTKVPILPINVGSLAFLSEINPENAVVYLNKFLHGDYKIEERARIKSTLNNRRLPDSVNEVVLETTITSKIRWFGVYLDDDFIHNIRADGIIIATPTGSTSYSLSVGGPIVDPKVKALVLSHMAPFSLTARSIVVPSESTLRVVTLDKGKNITLALDGQESVEVGYHDEMAFTESEYPAKFIRFESDFYKNTREKMQ